MESINFEILKTSRPELAELGAFAEQYVYVDPQSALVKLRSFGESIAKRIYSDLGFVEPLQWNFMDLLTADQFEEEIPKVIQDKLHSLRKSGNHAAHGGHVTQAEAMLALQQAQDLGKWVYMTFLGGKRTDCPSFKKPQAPESLTKADDAALRKEGDKLRAKLEEQEKRMRELLERLDQELSKTPEPSAARAAEMLAAGRSAVNELDYNEATTRTQLIDTALLAVGWDVKPDLQSSDEVGKEVELQDQPTRSGLGYADYVLWSDSHLPLAVIEAKKTSVDPEQGRKQAKDYADSLEKQYGQRPIIFYTNGFATRIWNDQAGEVPRNIYGFYSKDSLSYLIQQRSKVKALEQRAVNLEIVDRDYQIEAIKRVSARFVAKRRKALIVQATGTGKTRVAIALVDVLLQAQWAKRILFLCDRKELRKQAKNGFNQFIPSEPLTLVNKASARDKTSRIFLATYPAMMNYCESFDVGFFDLIIADESHRSIYNRYRELFQYFDAYQVGLTATPVHKITRNTYSLFDCEDQDPTMHYGYEEAVSEGHLVDFEVQVLTTGFLREGIKYSQMTQEQQQEVEEKEEDPTHLEYDQGAVDQRIMNKETNRLILRNLMENGIKDASGSVPGKSIIFARNHRHALLLQKLFEEMYPQYGGDFCRLIDNQEPRAEQLIDDFKAEGLQVEDERNKPRIAISVDMLDTGVDIPEVVNLVFAKPIKSYVKFWQMIGRGTRLRKDLFGPGKDKEKFLIFDHWQNFEWFDMHYKEREESPSKSLLQQLFESRLALADEAVRKMDVPASDLSISLLLADIADLPENTIAIRDKYLEVRAVRRAEVLQRMDAPTKAVLVNDIAPLMQWRNIRGAVPAYRFDLLIADLQLEHLRGSARVQDLRAEVQEIVSRLPITINVVREKAPYLQTLSSDDFWKDLTVAKLEELRLTVRSLVHYAEVLATPGIPPRQIDISEDENSIQRYAYIPRFEGLDQIAYRKRVKEALEQLVDTNPVLQKIRRAEAVSATELEALCSLILTERQIDLKLLKEFYPETRDLQTAITQTVGLDEAAVEEVFKDFLTLHHATLVTKQVQFLRMVKNYICKYGVIDIGKLYESPFTSIDSEGLDGVFVDEDQIEELLEILDRFKPSYQKPVQQLAN